MAGSDFTFNIAKGKVVYYANDAYTNTPDLIAVLLQATNLEADETLKDRTTLADILTGSAATSLEVPTSGPGVANYARYVFTVVLPAVDNSVGANWVSLDTDNAVWTNLGTSGGSVTTVGPNCTIGKLLICYRPAAGSATSAIIPLTAHTFDVTATDGTTLTATVNNFFRAV